MAPGLHLDFHYDVSCPFAYIASLRLPAFQRRHPTLTINYRPVLLGALYRATSAPQGAAGSASDTFNPTKRTVTSAGFVRTLRRLGVEYSQPPRHPLKTTRALRLLYCVDGLERVALTRSLYRAYWVEGRDVSELEELRSLVKGCEGFGAGTRERLLGLLETGEFEGVDQRRALEETTDLALQRGAFGVPAFWIQEEGRLYWGQDRLQFVDKALFSMENGGGQEHVLEALVPRCVPLDRREVPQGEEVKLEFWYDFSSPWAFLGWTQLARLQRIFGPRLKIEMKPFLLGILFREHVPLASCCEI
jgi:2-hydroxychromene-2-carboxylate isomerase